jgi:hypothetical protein
LRLLSSSRKANRIWVRRAKDVFAQDPAVRLAELITASASEWLARATRPDTCPVAGLVTSASCPDVPANSAPSSQCAIEVVMVLSFGG